MLELKDSDDLIEAYEFHHEPGNVWPEVIHSIRSCGIAGMRIYREGTRLTMVMDVEDSFEAAAKAANDISNPKVIEWECLMEAFQDTPNTGDAAGKWRSATCIFDLSDHRG